MPSSEHFKRGQINPFCSWLVPLLSVALLVMILDPAHAIVAGDPNGSPADSPNNRLDPNVPTSPYGGVGGVKVINIGDDNGACTGSALSQWSVLTAAHCFDKNTDGEVDSNISDVEFRLNLDGNSSSVILASDIELHPDYSGFNNPNAHDDLAVITLSSPLPENTPIYDLYSTPITSGTTLTLVGYGERGNGLTGYTGGSSFTNKRVGQNNADSFSLDDDGSGMNELFRYDFDGPTGNGIYGGGTLGNDLETIIGPGDSGGPAFVDINGELLLAGINTFTFGGESGQFGDRAGGVLLAPYINWIVSNITSPVSIPEPAGIIMAMTAVASIVGLKRLRVA